MVLGNLWQSWPHSCPTLAHSIVWGHYE
jgi:hypothetical protein